MTILQPPPTHSLTSMRCAGLCSLALRWQDLCLHHMFMCSMLCQRSTSSAQWMTRVNGLTAEKRECFRSKTAQRDIPGILIEQIQKCHIIRKLVKLCWCQAKWKKEVILSLREFLEMQDRYFQKNAADLTCDFSTLSCRRGQGTQALQNWRNLTASLKTSPDVCMHPPQKWSIRLLCSLYHWHGTFRASVSLLAYFCVLLWEKMGVLWAVRRFFSTSQNRPVDIYCRPRPRDGKPVLYI